MSFHYLEANGGNGEREKPPTRPSLLQVRYWRVWPESKHDIHFHFNDEKHERENQKPFSPFLDPQKEYKTQKL